MALGGHAGYKQEHEVPDPEPYYEGQDYEMKKSATTASDSAAPTEVKPTWIQWSTSNKNGLYYPEGHVELVTKIPNGYFELGYDGQAGKYFLRKLRYLTDEVYLLPMPEIDAVLKDITSFWDNGAKFREYGLTFKRGILLHGPPGGGKSHIIQLIIRNLIRQQDGIVLRIQNQTDLTNFENFVLPVFRRIEQNRKLFVIILVIDRL